MTDAGQQALDLGDGYGGAQPGITQAEFARRQGYSRQHVQRLKQHGRLVYLPNGRVDPEASQALIADTASADHQHAAERAQRYRDCRAGKEADSPRITAAPNQGAIDAKREREGIRHERALIELGLLRGELLDRDDVDHEWSRFGVSLRANLEAMVERLAPALGAAQDRAQIDATIDAEMRVERHRVNRELAGAVRALDEAGQRRKGKP